MPPRPGLPPSPVTSYPLAPEYLPAPHPPSDDLIQNSPLYATDQHRIRFPRKPLEISRPSVLDSLVHDSEISGSRLRDLRRPYSALEYSEPSSRYRNREYSIFAECALFSKNPDPDPHLHEVPGLSVLDLR